MVNCDELEERIEKIFTKLSKDPKKYVIRNSEVYMIM